MSDYRLPMDADGVKYHGTVDQNEENPGQFMYGLDENGNKRIIRTDEQGNVLTRLTGSNVEEITVLPRAIRTDNAYASSNTVEVSADAKVAILELRVYGGTGTFSDGEGYRLQVMRQTTGRVQQDYIAQCRFSSHFGSNKTGNLINISPTFFEKEDDERRILDVQSTFYPSFRPMLSISGTFGAGEGIDCELKVYIVY